MSTTTLTPEQIAAFPTITAPLQTLDELRILALPVGSTDIKRVIRTSSTCLFLGTDNRLYANSGRVDRFLSYRSNPDSHFFGDTMLRALRAAKLVTTTAITKHRAFMRESEAAYRFTRKVRAFEQAAKDLGIKPTRQQMRDIAKLAPKKGGDQ